MESLRVSAEKKVTLEKTEARDRSRGRGCRAGVSLAPPCWAG